MSYYTMTIEEMLNNPLTPIFPEEYPFYCDDAQIKKEFEEKFIQANFLREIGFETPYAFQQQFKAKMMVLMPYYQQLYQTEWDKVKSVEQMMTSKDLTETTTRSLTGNQTGTNEQSQTGTNSQSGKTSQTSNQSSTSEQSTTSESSSNQSSLADGVSSVSLDEGYLTGVAKTNDTGSVNASGSSNTTGSTESTLTDTSSVTNSTESSLRNTQEETITFTSKGDIGVQTPAYAIEQWRNIIINIDEMILNDLNTLFLKIY